MATKREVFLACQEAVNEAIVKQDVSEFPLDKLAVLAAQYGREVGKVTEEEAKEMLTKSLVDIARYG